MVLVKTKRFDGEEISVKTEYNKKGEVTKKSLPHTESETAQYIVYSYDEQGRPVETVKPSPKGGNATVSESITYDGLSVTVTSPGANKAEHTKTTKKNVLGQVVKVDQEEGTYVEYTYDAIGNLKTTTPNGNEAYTITMEYDKLGNKKSMKDPDMGYWTYTYDALGQLKSQTDAKKQVTTIEYDQLGRKTSETNADGTSTWVYDTAIYGKGKLATESTDGISKSYSYDSKGRVKDVNTTIYNKNFTQSYAYNADGKLETTTQPNGFKLINSYNAQGYLESIKSPAGQIKDSSIPNNNNPSTYVELMDKSASWKAFGEIYANKTSIRTYNGEKYTYVPTKTAGSGAYKSVATEVGETYTVSAELVGADVNRNESFSANTYLAVSSTVPVKGIPVVDNAGVLAFVVKSGSAKAKETFTFVAKSTTSYISVRSDRNWKYANARAISVKEYGSDESTNSQTETTTNDNEDCDTSTSIELIDESASWIAVGDIWKDRTSTRTYNSEKYTYIPVKTAGSGAYKSVATEVGETYTVSAELVGADVNRNEDFSGNSYVTVSSKTPKRDESGVIKKSSKVTGSTKITKTFTFVATTTKSYIAVRSDKGWKYANVRALSVKKVSCSGGVVANTKVKDGYVKTSNHKTSRAVSPAYKTVLSDSEYIYHYKVLEQTSLGQVTKYLSGNGLITEDEYTSAGTMTASKTGYLGDDGVRDLSYEYYDNYSLSKRTDSKLGIVQEYGYDALDRIEYATVNSNKYGFASHNYDYDVYGNLKIKSEVYTNKSLDEYKELKYENGNHQVSSLEDGKIFEYDPNGNMIKNGDSTIEYNAINKPTKIKTKDTTLTFTYDMNGNRYLKSKLFTDTYYIGKGYEYTEDGNKNKTHKYLIYANGKVVTVHDETSQIDYQTGKERTTHNTQYLHYDSLGSVDTITNQQGSVVERMAYKPFGEQIDLTKLGKSITNRGYTGHEHIKGTDFIHMNARLYDPTIGRFLSADTVIQAPYDSQSYNRYSYVRNNPLKYTDPTGHSWLSKAWKKVKREYRRFERKVSAHADEIVGVVAMIGGAIMIGTGWGAEFGYGLMATGAGLIKGEYHIFNGEDGNINVGYSVTYPTTWGQSGGGLTTTQGSSFGRETGGGYEDMSYIDENGQLGSRIIPSRSANLRGGVGYDLFSVYIYTQGGYFNVLDYLSTGIGGNQPYHELVNGEHRISFSATGGALGKGGTVEVGYSIAHDSNENLNEGWSGTGFGTWGAGGFNSTDFGVDFNFGWSDNNNVSALNGKATIIGHTRRLGAYNVGYETTISSSLNVSPLHTVTISRYVRPKFNIAESETHVYYSETYLGFSWGLK